MYYPEYISNDDDIILPNPYGLPPDPVFESKEKKNDNDYFNAVIKQMYHTHKNKILFPAPINCSKSMEISKLEPIEPMEPVQARRKRTVRRHKSDPTGTSECKKKRSFKNSNKDKKNSRNSKEDSHQKCCRNIKTIN